MRAHKNIAILGANFKVASDDFMAFGGCESQLEKLGIELGKKAQYKVSLIFEGIKRCSGSSTYYDWYSMPDRWSSFHGALKLLNMIKQLSADIILVRSSTPHLLIFGIIAKILKAKVIYFATNNWEFTNKPEKVGGWRWRSFILGLQLCSCIFVQNEYQLRRSKRLLLVRKKRILRIVSNFPLLDRIESPLPPGEDFTWVGIYRSYKRPEWILDIAKQLTDKKFCLVLHFDGDTKSELIFTRAAKMCDNVKLIRGLRRDQLYEIYKKASALLITSEVEGFPNVAIEAWSQARAVISTPVGALQNLGKPEGTICAKDIGNFVNIIKNVSTDDLEKIGLNGYNYFNSNFSTSRIIKRIEEYF
ncbi:glycosyltransferase family 4 protein [Candidatus Omnitrophota bacterium]